MGIEIVVLLVLIVLNAFFAASEIALISLNDNKIKLMADSGNKKAKMLHNLTAEPSRFLATIQIGITLAGFLASAFAAESFAGRMAVFLNDMGVPLSQGMLELISVITITLVLSYFTLVLGELVPKRLALQKAEPIAMFAAGPLTVLSKISSPFVKLLTLSTNGIVRLFGVDPNAESEHVTEEEIRMMVDVGREKGTIQDSEKVMINNIFEFDNKTVSDIMTHRTNIAALSADASLKEIVKVVNQEKYTRMPVYNGDMDHIIGILHTKDLIPFIDGLDPEEFNLRGMLREPSFVLESMRLDQLFRDMQKSNIHMAIVIDEYGGTDGVVTIEDLIEEIVGNIFDEYDEPELDVDEIEQIDQNHFIMAGTLNLYEVENRLKAELPRAEYDTLSGFILGQLGYIPGPNEQPEVEYEGIVFTVAEMNDRRIARVNIRIKDSAAAME